MTYEASSAIVTPHQASADPAAWVPEIDTINPREFWDNGELWAKRFWNADWWHMQRWIAWSCRNNQNTAVATGNGLGKTEIISQLAILYSLAFYPSWVLIVSASWKLLDETIWPRVRHNISVLRQYMPDLAEENSEAWMPFGPRSEHGILCLSPTMKEAIGGRHNTHVLAIMDEASGMEMGLFSGLLSVASKTGSRALMTGNPFQPSGPFFDAFTRNKAKGPDDQVGWHSRNFSQYDSPNYRARKIIIPGVITFEGVKQFEARHANEPIEALPRIHGRFPDETLMTIISRADLMKASEVEPVPLQSGITIGVDMSWGGTDKTIFCVRDDRRIVRMDEFAGIKEPEIARKIVEYLHEWTIDGLKPTVNVDATGNPSVIHILEDSGVKDVNKVVFNRRANDDSRFKNVRAEMYWAMREALRSGQFHVPEKFLGPLIDQAGIQMKRTENGIIQVEVKTEVMKRIGHSPDHLDALAISFATPLGMAAFRAVEPILHRVRFPLAVRANDDGGYDLMFDAPGIDPMPRPGVLARGIWTGISGDSNCVWLHIDSFGNMTEFDSCASGLSRRDFCARVVERSAGMRFVADSFAAFDDERGQTAFYDEFMRQYPLAIPAPMRADILHGRAGVEEIEAMFAGTLAYYPENSYWRGDAVAAERAKGSPMLLIRSEEVLDELLEARLKSPSWRSQAQNVDQIQDIGGGFVKALRIAVIASAGVLLPQAQELAS